RERQMPHGITKALEPGDDLIVTGLEIGKTEAAFRIGDGCGRDVGLDVTRVDGCARKRAAAGVADLAAETCAMDGLLRECAAGPGEHEARAGGNTYELHDAAPRENDRHVRPPGTRVPMRRIYRSKREVSVGEVVSRAA